MVAELPSKTGAMPLWGIGIIVGIFVALLVAISYASHCALKEKNERIKTDKYARSVVVWTIIAFLGLGVFVQALLLPEYDPLEAQGSRGLASQMPKDTAGVVEEGPCSTAESEDRPPSF